MLAGERLGELFQSVVHFVVFLLRRVGQQRFQRGAGLIDQRGIDGKLLHAGGGQLELQIA